MIIDAEQERTPGPVIPPTCTFLPARARGRAGAALIHGIREQLSDAVYQGGGYLTPSSRRTLTRTANVDRLVSGASRSARGTEGRRGTGSSLARCTGRRFRTTGNGHAGRSTAGGAAPGVAGVFRGRTGPPYDALFAVPAIFT